MQLSASEPSRLVSAQLVLPQSVLCSHHEHWLWVKAQKVSKNLHKNRGPAIWVYLQYNVMTNIDSYEFSRLWFVFRSFRPDAVQTTPLFLFTSTFIAAIAFTRAKSTSTTARSTLHGTAVRGHIVVQRCMMGKENMSACCWTQTVTRKGSGR